MKKQINKKQKIESPLINKNTITTNNIIQEQTSNKKMTLHFMEFGILINIILNYLCGQTQMEKISKNNYLV